MLWRIVAICVLAFVRTFAFALGLSHDSVDDHKEADQRDDRSHDDTTCAKDLSRKLCTVCTTSSRHQEETQDDDPHGDR